MTSKVSWWPAVFLVAMAACSAESSERDLVTTVQETNVDDTPQCEAGTAYSRTTTRACDGVMVIASVCSEEEVCAAQLDELEAAVSRCEIDLGTTQWSPTVECE